MDGGSPTDGLLGDDPVSDESHDVLARGPFAARVVELIEHVSNETPSAVLALMGPWGSGKTSVLLFARRRFDSGGRWKVVEFNPWMVSDLPSLVQEFFTTLVAALPDDRKGKRLRRKMAGYARSVAPLTAPFKIFGIDRRSTPRTRGSAAGARQADSPHC
jgi:predicted KAP-like P-loop ATPase